MKVSSKCLWDNNMDNLATHTYITVITILWLNNTIRILLGYDNMSWSSIRHIYVLT